MWPFVVVAPAALDGLSAAQLSAKLAGELERIDATNSSRATVAAIVGEVVEEKLPLTAGLRRMISVSSGKSSGHAAGTPLYRDAADTKNRLAAVTTVDGDRTSITTDGT